MVKHVVKNLLILDFQFHLGVKLRYSYCIKADMPIKVEFITMKINKKCKFFRLQKNEVIQKNIKTVPNQIHFV